MENKQKELTEELIKASNAYYNTGVAIMSDREFDKKLEELKALEKESGEMLPGSPTVNVGAKKAIKVDALKTVTHEWPALSLDKVKYENREDLVAWAKNQDVVISWKLDGLTVVLTYDNGTLTSAVTRGDGIEGSDITHNAIFFEGVPTKISALGHVVLRGEALMAFDEFERVNTEADGVYENPRNLAAATIQMLDAEESSKRKIMFKAFELVVPDVDTLIGDDSARGHIDIFYNLALQKERLDWLKSLGFGVVDNVYVKPENILEEIEKWKDKLPDLAYPTDGLVISYEDMKYGLSLGNTQHHFRHSIALKWTDETKQTVIRDIEWSVGKTGIITPVAIFDPVRLGLGSTVTRASLHNLSIAGRLAGGWYGDCNGSSPEWVAHKLAIKNCKADVYMANMIIPQVDTIYRGDDEEFIYMPTTCPVCGGKVEVVKNNGIKTLHCTNHDGCPAQQIGKLVNSFSKDGLNVKGLSEKKIEFLVNEGYVESVLDFYRLKNQGNEMGVCKKDGSLPVLEMQPGWEIKSVDNLLASIEKSRNTTLQKFLYSLNIPLLGNDLSKKIARYLKDDVKHFLEMITYSASYKDELIAELTAIDGVGEEKAKNIAEWAQDVATDKDKCEYYHALVGELIFPAPQTQSADSSLEGLTFVITGSVNIYKNRDEFKASVEARGGKVAGSVSAKTTALVNNDVTSTSGKNQKAKELGVRIISEEEFVQTYGR